MLDGLGVLGGDDDRLDADRPAAVVLHGDLGLAVGPEEVELALAPRLRQTPHDELCASVSGSGM